MNDTTENLPATSSSSSGMSHNSRSSRTIASQGVVASLMNNETDSEATGSLSSTVDEINLTSLSVESATMSTIMHKPTMSTIEFSHKIVVSVAQPLVMDAPTTGASMNSDSGRLDEINQSSNNVTGGTISPTVKPCKSIKSGAHYLIKILKYSAKLVLSRIKSLL